VQEIIVKLYWLVPLVMGVSYSLGNMAPAHANFHQLISIEKLKITVSVCRYIVYFLHNGIKYMLN